MHVRETSAKISRGSQVGMRLDWRWELDEWIWRPYCHSGGWYSLPGGATGSTSLDPACVKYRTTGLIELMN